MSICKVRSDCSGHGCPVRKGHFVMGNLEGQILFRGRALVPEKGWLIIPFWCWNYFIVPRPGNFETTLQPFSWMMKNVCHAQFVRRKCKVLKVAVWTTRKYFSWEVLGQRNCWLHECQTACFSLRNRCSFSFLWACIPLNLECQQDKYFLSLSLKSFMHEYLLPCTFVSS